MKKEKKFRFFVKKVRYFITNVNNKIISLKGKKEKKYGAHSHVRATARLVNTHYSQQRSAVRSTAPINKNKIIRNKIG